jgi:hypothetical protein
MFIELELSRDNVLLILTEILQKFTKKKLTYYTLSKNIANTKNLYMGKTGLMLLLGILITTFFFAFFRTTRFLGLILNRCF